MQRLDSNALRALVVTSELVAFFPALVGSKLLSASPAGYASIWPMAAAAAVGLGLALPLASVRSSRWVEVAIVAFGVVLCAGPALVLTHSRLGMLTVLVLLALAYWRGVSAAMGSPGHAGVLHRYVVGIGILLLAIAGLGGEGSLRHVAVWHALAISGIALTVVALLALTVSQLEPVRPAGAGESVMAVVMAELILLAALCFAATVFFTLNLAAVVERATAPIGDVLTSAFVAILHIVLTPLLWLTQFLHSHMRPVHRRPRLVHAIVPAKTFLQSLPHVNGPWMVLLIIWLALLLSLLIALVVRRNRRLVDGKSREETDEISSRTGYTRPLSFWQALLQWLRSLVRQGREAAGNRASVVRRRVLGKPYPSDPVRRVYARMLRLAGRQGLSRPASTTPFEFALLLAQQWPDGASDFAAMTDAYVRRRYREVLPAQAELDDVTRRWKRIRALMQTRRAVPDATP